MQQEIDNISVHGLYKVEPDLALSQSASIGVEFDSSQRQVLNFCANHYAGLADNHQIIESAKKLLRSWVKIQELLNSPKSHEIAVQNKGGNQYLVEDITGPERGFEDVKIKIHRTAICGTDIHIYNWDNWT